MTHHPARSTRHHRPDSSHPTRRSLLTAGLGTAAATGIAATLGGCGPSSKPGGGSTADGLRVSWYGGQPVHTGIESALQAYRDSGVSTKITSEKSTFDDYWDKLATQVAARQGPDVLRMSMTWFSDYADRGALLDLGDLVESTIDVSALDEDVAAGGSVDGTRYGIGQSSITQACFTNPGLVKDAGGSLPDSWTWDDFATFCADFASSAGKGKYGSTDIGGDFQMFEAFARAHGTELFDGQSLAVGADVIEEWMTLWQDLRDAEAVPPADITAEGGTFEESPFAKLNTAVAFGWVQQVQFYQDAMADSVVEVADLPGTKAGDVSGQFLQALDFWCISSTSVMQEDAGKLIDFLLNDEAAVTSIGTTLGVPPSQDSRDVLDADPDSAAGRAIAYVESVSGRTGPTPEPWPQGYGSIQGDLFGKLSQDIAFGEIGISEGVAAFVADANAALGG